MSDEPSLATAFSSSAAQYERGRPGYPPGVIELLTGALGVGPGSRVLDLAAGTGKLTRQLVATGAEVVAVEPLAEMRAELERAVPRARSLAGSAEAIPLDDASVEVVTVAQAFHWFEPVVALAEIARVLRPGGWLFLVWNEGDHRDPLTNELLGAMRAAGSRPETVERDWRIVLDESGRFEPARRGRFRWRAPVTHAEALASVESRSYVSALPPEQRLPFLAGIAELLAGWPEPFEHAYATEAHWCRLSPS